MRIRSTKPEFWCSERIGLLSWEDRLVFKGLESYVDDNGVGKDDIALIVGQVFPRDMLANPRETVARVTEGISRIHRAGMLWRYTAAGTRLLYVSFWESAQRIDKPTRGRFPRPDGTMNYGDSLIRESFANPPEILAPGTEEQGNRGTGEISRTPVQTEPHSDEPAPIAAAASATPGADLVRAIVPKGHPSATLTSLRIQASELLNTGTDPDTVADALRLWCDKPGVGNGRTILASLCSEVIKARTAPRRKTNGTDQKAREYLTLAAQLDGDPTALEALP